MKNYNEYLRNFDRPGYCAGIRMQLWVYNRLRVRTDHWGICYGSADAPYQTYRLQNTDKDYACVVHC